MLLLLTVKGRSQKRTRGGIGRYRRTLGRSAYLAVIYRGWEEHKVGLLVWYRWCVRTQRLLLNKPFLMMIRDEGRVVAWKNGCCEAEIGGNA